MEHFFISTPIGTLGLDVHQGYVTKIRLCLDKPSLAPFPELVLKAAKELNEYFSGDRKKFTFPWKLQARGFHKLVLEALMTVPYGTTVSYKELAKMAGNDKAARAAGTACKANPLPIVIPCHRVIKSNGDTGRYGFGASTKINLINLEESGSC